MEIKLISLNEIDSVLRIYDEGASQMIKDGCLTWKNNYPNRDMAKEDIDNNSIYGVYNEDGDILGLFTLDSIAPPHYDEMDWKTDGQPFLTFHRLAVAEKGKGQGIGGKLIDFSINMAREGGYKSVRMDAYHKNWRALKLYESKGFVRVGTVQFEKNDGENFCLEYVIK